MLSKKRLNSLIYKYVKAHKAARQSLYDYCGYMRKDGVPEELILNTISSLVQHTDRIDEKARSIAKARIFAILRSYIK